jgi:uncharacterized delta-60 repeat protein
MSKSPQEINQKQKSIVSTFILLILGVVLSNSALAVNNNLNYSDSLMVTSSNGGNRTNSDFTTNFSIDDNTTDINDWAFTGFAKSRDGQYYMATNEGMSISTDAGISWENILPADGLVSNASTSVAVGEMASNWILLGSQNNGISLSLDNGATWATYNVANDSLVADKINSVAISGDGTLYIATDDGLSVGWDTANTLFFENIDQAVEATLPGNQISQVLVDETGNDYALYLATTSGLAVATTRGGPFTTYLAGYATSSIVVKNGVWYVGVLNNNGKEPGVYISIDNGATFTLRKIIPDTPLNVRHVQVTEYAIYAGTQFGLGVSTDGGEIFTFYTTAESGLTGDNIVVTEQLLDDAISGIFALGETNIQLVARERGVSISKNSGLTYTSYDSTTNGIESDVINSVSYLDDASIVITSDSGLSLTNDFGTTWSASLPGIALTKSHYHHTLNKLAVGSSNHGLYLSSDKGLNFMNKTTADGLLSNIVSSAVFADDGTLYVAHPGTGGVIGGVSYSNDNGATFTTVQMTEMADILDPSGDPGLAIHHIAVSNGNIYLATVNGIEVSSDNMASFTNYLNGVVVRDITFENNSTWYASTEEGLKITTDNGANFTTFDSTLPDSVVNNVVVDQNGLVYVSTNGGLIHFSDDGSQIVNINTDDINSGYSSNHINQAVILAPQYTDTDADGFPDKVDTDDDNDGALDEDDAFPLDAAETTDTDNDGTGNNADTDDDNDGVTDALDFYPLISLNGLTDTDNDGIPDVCDTACTSLGMTADVYVTGVIYVSHNSVCDAVNETCGQDWDNAFPFLQDALEVATVNNNIWVAKGLYYTDDNAAGNLAGNRSATFTLANQVGVYGGFDDMHTATQLSDADPELYVTVLTADIGKDDTLDGNGIIATYTDIVGDNGYMVVKDSALVHSFTLQGFTINGGGSATFDTSGGIYLEFSGGTLKDLQIIANEGYRGTALYHSADLNDNCDTMLIDNVLIKNNREASYGVMFLDSVSCNSYEVNQLTMEGNAGGTLIEIYTFESITFNHLDIANNGIDQHGFYIEGDENVFITINNSSISSTGEGLYFYQTSANLNNVTLFNNQTAIITEHLETESIVANHLTIVGNANNNNDGIIDLKNGTFTLKNSIIAGNLVDGIENNILVADNTTFIDGGNNRIGHSGVSGVNGQSGQAYIDYFTHVTSATPTSALNEMISETLADNGGWAQSLMPLNASLLIDAIPVDECSLTLDQRDQARPYNNACDIGAVEVQLDTDNDGVEDTIDTDDDNDGVMDNVDIFPLDPLESEDSDADGVGDNADVFPNNATETTDTDFDGIGNNADTDDDGDGMPDVWENTHGFNTLNGADAFSDPDGDLQMNLDEYLHNTNPHELADVQAPLVNSFGESGISKVFAPAQLSDEENDIIGLNSSTIQLSDGRLIISGYRQDNSGVDDIFFASFNNQGEVENNYANSNSYFADGIFPIEAFNHVVDFQDRVLVTSYQDGGQAVMRLDDSGNLDSTFASDGYFDDLNDDYRINKVLPLTNGNYLLTGLYSNGAFKEGVLVQLMSDGSLNTNYGNTGILNIKPYYPDEDEPKIRNIIEQVNGKILLVVRKDDGAEVIRLNVDGSLDNSFNYNFRATQEVDVGEADFVIHLQKDGKLIVDTSDGLVRLNVDSSIDNSFNAGVALEISYPNLSSFDEDHDQYEDLSTYFQLLFIHQQVSGKIIVASKSHQGVQTSFHLRRYLTDGVLDTSYDDDGISRITLSEFTGHPDDGLKDEYHFIDAFSTTNEDVIFTTSSMYSFTTGEVGLLARFATGSVDIDGDGYSNSDEIANGTDHEDSNSVPANDNDGDFISDLTDTDDDNDGVADTSDAFPLDNSESVDTDGDGIGNNTDPDDDNDGVADTSDAFPLDNSESVDTDGDGIGNNTDPDDDNDGVADTSDAFPLDNSESVDTDGDGIGNNIDTDDDGDGVLDVNDAFPLDNSESLDTDLDGIGNNADTDDDGDGILDIDDESPLDPTIGDTQAPVIADVEAVIFEATGEFTDISLVTPEVTDNGTNIPSITSNLDEPLALGEHIVTWTATDAAGNQSFKEQLVTIIDTTPPAFEELTPITINAEGRLTNIVAALNLSAHDLVDGDLVAQLMGESSLISGLNAVELTVSDHAGNVATSLQEINILPRIDITSKLTVEAGGSYIVDANLSGSSATYPVDINAQLIRNGQVVDEIFTEITQGVKGVVSFTVPADSLLVDELSLLLIDTSNAFVGKANQTELTVTEENIAPKLTLSVTQDGKIVSVVDPDNGNVTLSVSVTDVNESDNHDMFWSDETGEFTEASNVLSYNVDPSALAEGSYSMQVTATENNTEAALSVSQTVRFIVEQLADLDEETDSDADGIVDSEEGYSDSDGDGIADYLDDDSNTTRLPSAENTEPMQTSPGLTMSLGSLVASQGSSSEDASLTVDDLAALVGDDAADTQDNHYEATTPLYNFTIAGLAEQGDSVAVVIPLTAGNSLPEGAVYRKYNTTNGWFNFVEDDNNNVSSALADTSGNCPAASDASYSTGLTQGDNCIQLIIEDGGPNDADFTVNGSIEDPGAVVIENENQAPVIDLPSSYEVDEETELTLDASNTADAEGDSLSYIWIQLSGTDVELTDSTTAQLTFVSPSVSEDEVLTFELTVEDGEDTSTATTEVTVYQINQAPSVSIDSHESSAVEGTVMILISQGSDPDNDSLSYQWEQLSGPSISFDDANAAQVSIALPAVNSDEVVEVQVTVTDGELSSTTTTSFTVTNDVEVITVTPEKESSGGSIGWLLMLFLVLSAGKQFTLNRIA